MDQCTRHSEVYNQRGISPCSIIEFPVPFILSADPDPFFWNYDNREKAMRLMEMQKMKRSSDRGNYYYKGEKGTLVW